MYCFEYKHIQILDAFDICTIFHTWQVWGAKNEVIGANLLYNSLYLLLYWLMMIFLSICQLIFVIIGPVNFNWFCPIKPNLQSTFCHGWNATFLMVIDVLIQISFLFITYQGPFSFWCPYAWSISNAPDKKTFIVSLSQLLCYLSSCDQML